MLLNDILSGRYLEKEWQESRVGLVYKEGGMKELKKCPTSGNYKCSVQVIYGDGKRENKRMAEESGMLCEIQGASEMDNGDKIFFKSEDG